MGFFEKLFFQLQKIHDIAVVGGGDAVGVVDPERLGVLHRALAHGRVAGVAQADVALQARDVVLVENVAHQAVAFFQVVMAVVGQDAGRILAAVLQGQQAGIQLADHRFGRKNSQYAAHDAFFIA